MQQLTADTVERLATTLAECREKVEAMTAILEQIPTSNFTANLHRNFKRIRVQINASEAFIESWWL